jgi:hypothetical protein
MTMRTSPALTVSPPAASLLTVPPCSELMWFPSSSPRARAPIGPLDAVADLDRHLHDRSLHRRGDRAVSEPDDDAAFGLGALRLRRPPAAPTNPSGRSAPTSNRRPLTSTVMVCSVGASGAVPVVPASERDRWSTFLEPTRRACPPQVRMRGGELSCGTVVDAFHVELAHRPEHAVPARSVGVPTRSACQRGCRSTAIVSPSSSRHPTARRVRTGAQ